MNPGRDRVPRPHQRSSNSLGFLSLYFHCNSGTRELCFGIFGAKSLRLQLCRYLCAGHLLVTLATESGNSDPTGLHRHFGLQAVDDELHRYLVDILSGLSRLSTKSKTSQPCDGASIAECQEAKAFAAGGCCLGGKPAKQDPSGETNWVAKTSVRKKWDSRKSNGRTRSLGAGG